jgi:Cytochrome oxidase complex assembly protein 1
MPTPPYPLVPAPVTRTWLDRHARWKIPLGCLLAIGLLVAFVAILFTVIDYSFRKSDVYREALARAERNSEVANRIGVPLRPGRVVQGQINVSGSTGTSNMEIPVTGPRGKAAIVFDARKTAGTWVFRTLYVQFEGQSGTVNLLEDASAGTQ